MITDELREWLENAYTYGTGENLFKKNYSPWFGWKPVLEPMLDRIDAEHESKVSYWQETSYKDGYDEGFASADDYFTDKRETLEEHGWVKLPVDADGVPIRVGDVMEWPDCSTAEVVGIGNNTFFYVEKGDDAAEWSCANDKIHHHEPTVEDVLEEFSCVLMGKREFDGDVTKAIAEYAAKLRLKED